MPISGYSQNGVFYIYGDPEGGLVYASTEESGPQLYLGTPSGNLTPCGSGYPGDRTIDASSLLGNGLTTFYSTTTAAWTLIGSAQADQLSAGSGADTMKGGDGDDQLLGYGGSDKLYGGNGADEVFGYDGNDRLKGDDGDDLLTGNAGDDTLTGGRGNDRLSGDAGDDTVVASGKRSDYTLVFENGDYHLTDSKSGRDGSDWIANVSHIRFSDQTVDLDRHHSHLDATVSAGAFAVGGHARTSGQIMVSLSNDSLIVADAGAVGETVAVSGDGSAVHSIDLHGLRGAGATMFIYTDDQETIHGSKAADAITVYSATNGDRVYGGLGDDTIAGWSGNDRFFGDSGNDHLSGGGGDDVLRGSSGSDVIDGGDGDDTALFEGKQSDYSIAVRGGHWQLTGKDGAVDDVVGVEHFHFADRTVDMAAHPTALTPTVSGHTLTIGGEAADASDWINMLWDDPAAIIDSNHFGRLPVTWSWGDIHTVDLRDLDAPAGVHIGSVGGSGIKNVFGSAGNDFIDLSVGGGHAYGGGGNDALFAAGGAFLSGGSGNDLLEGNNGDDVLEGGRGDDTLWGGFEGDDVAVFSGNRDDYSFAAATTQKLQVTDIGSGHHDGVDIVYDVHWLQFADGKVAFTDVFPHG